MARKTGNRSHPLAWDQYVLAQVIYFEYVSLRNILVAGLKKTSGEGDLPPWTTPEAWVYYSAKIVYAAIARATSKGNFQLMLASLLVAILHRAGVVARQRC